MKGAAAAGSVGPRRGRPEALDSYVRCALGTGSPQVEQLATLAEMHDKGAISDQEYQAAKEKVLH